MELKHCLQRKGPLPNETAVPAPEDNRTVAQSMYVRHEAPKKVPKLPIPVMNLESRADLPVEKPRAAR